VRKPFLDSKWLSLKPSNLQTPTWAQIGAQRPESIHLCAHIGFANSGIEFRLLLPDVRYCSGTSTEVLLTHTFEFLQFNENTWIQHDCHSIACIVSAFSVEAILFPYWCDRPPWILVSILCLANAWHAGKSLCVSMHSPAYSKKHRR